MAEVNEDVKKLKESLEGAVEIETKEGRVRMPSVSDRIKANQYVNGLEAAAGGAPYGIRIARTKHTGNYG